MRIEDVTARALYNGRGDPAIEAEVRVHGVVGRAISPSGASKSKHEVVSFSPGGPMATARMVQRYKRRLFSADPANPASVTSVLKKIDGTANYSRIGGSAAYSISVASASAAALSKGITLCRLIDPKNNKLPLPLGNVIGGGKHGGPKSPSVQEILVAAVGARSLREAIELNLSVHAEIGRRLSESESYPVGRGDEGGWAPGVSDEAALLVAKEASEQVADKEGRRLRVGLDFAAGSLYDEKNLRYFYRASGKSLTREGQISYVSELADKFDLFYIEDPLQEEDFDGFARITSSLPSRLVIGDDLYTTNRSRLSAGIARRSTSGAVMKVNQVGTLGEAIEFSRYAREAGNVVVASHRSGDNESGSLAHFAVGMGCALIKTGVVGGERTAKLNELLRLEESVGTRFVGFAAGK